MKKFLSICALLVVVAAVLIWYHLPMEREAAVELHYAETGKETPAINTFTAEFDLKISRSLFAPPVIDGTIRIGDVNYVVWGRQKYTFFSNLLRKVKGEMNLPSFVDPANYGKGVDKLLGDLFHLYSIQFGDNYTIENATFIVSSDRYENGFWSSSNVF